MASRACNKKYEESMNTEDEINIEDYAVNLLDMLEEDRVIKGFHEIYGKLYDEINLKIRLNSKNGCLLFYFFL